MPPETGFVQDTVALLVVICVADKFVGDGQFVGAYLKVKPCAGNNDAEIPHVDVFADPLTEVAQVLVPVTTALFLIFVGNVLLAPLKPT